MNIRSIIISAIFLVISSNVFAQKDVVQLFINGKKIGEVTVAEKPGIFRVNKLKYKKIYSLLLIVKQSSVINVYRRTLQITDINENYLYQVNEPRLKPGFYKIEPGKIRQQLLKQRILKIFLAEDPVNDMMKLPSKRKLLAELHFR